MEDVEDPTLLDEAITAGEQLLDALRKVRATGDPVAINRLFDVGDTFEAAMEAIWVFLTDTLDALQPEREH